MSPGNEVVTWTSGSYASFEAANPAEESQAEDVSTCNSLIITARSEFIDKRCPVCGGQMVAIEVDGEPCKIICAYCGFEHLEAESEEEVKRKAEVHKCKLIAEEL